MSAQALIDESLERMRAVGRLEGILGAVNWLRLEGFDALADAMVLALQYKVNAERAKP